VSVDQRARISPPTAAAAAAAACTVTVLIFLGFAVRFSSAATATIVLLLLLLLLLLLVIVGTIAASRVCSCAPTSEATGASPSASGSRRKNTERTTRRGQEAANIRGSRRET
jgi:protein-S-isoprenylcysteine O-methyltransferase Ste14